MVYDATSADPATAVGAHFRMGTGGEKALAFIALMPPLGVVFRNRPQLLFPETVPRLCETC